MRWPPRWWPLPANHPLTHPPILLATEAFLTSVWWAPRVADGLGSPLGLRGGALMLLAGNALAVALFYPPPNLRRPPVYRELRAPAARPALPAVHIDYGEPELPAEAPDAAWPASEEVREEARRRGA